MDYALVSLGMLMGIGIASAYAGNVIRQLRDKIFELEIENEKFENQRDMWHRVADLPEDEQHRPILTPEELERRRDVVSDRMDELDL